MMMQQDPLAKKYVCAKDIKVWVTSIASKGALAVNDIPKAPVRMENWTRLDRDTLRALDMCSEEEIFLYLVQNFNLLKSGRKRIELHTLTDDDFYHLTRFSSSDISQISKLLGLPNTIVTPSRYIFTKEEAFFLLCCWFSWPNGLKTLELLSGYSSSMISECVNWMSKFIHNNWDFVLQDFSSNLLSSNWLSQFSNAVNRRTNALTNCWGFLDCTIREICRPVVWQQALYSGCNQYRYWLVSSIAWYSVCFMIEFDTHDVLCLVSSIVWYAVCFMYCIKISFDTWYVLCNVSRLPFRSLYGYCLQGSG